MTIKLLIALSVLAFANELVVAKSGEQLIVCSVDIVAPIDAILANLLAAADPPFSFEDYLRSEPVLVLNQVNKPSCKLTADHNLAYDTRVVELVENDVLNARALANGRAPFLLFPEVAFDGEDRVIVQTGAMVLRREGTAVIAYGCVGPVILERTAGQWAVKEWSEKRACA